MIVDKIRYFSNEVKQYLFDLGRQWLKLMKKKEKKPTKSIMHSEYYLKK